MDQFSAIWLSHSAINTFRACPRAYYLSYLYRDPRNNHKINFINPSMALGSAVHEVLESLSVLPVAQRFELSLLERLEPAWDKVRGQRGGFADDEEEARYRTRAQEMLRRVMQHPGPLEHKAVKIQQDLPHYWLSEADNLILCGKLDWLEYLEADDAVRIIDFKTGLKEENVDSLQLPIYYLLAHNCQERPVTGVSYWYLAQSDFPISQSLPDPDKAHALLLKIGKELKLARSLQRFKCPSGLSGCKHCEPFEKILRGEAQFVGVGEYNADIYTVGKSLQSTASKIL